MTPSSWAITRRLIAADIAVIIVGGSPADATSADHNWSVGSLRAGDRANPRFSRPQMVRLRRPAAALLYLCSEAASLLSASSGQKPTFQSCRLVRSPSTYNGGHEKWGPSGNGLTNLCQYRSLLPDCPTVVVVRADHAAAAPGQKGARSIVPRQPSRTPTWEEVSRRLRARDCARSEAPPSSRGSVEHCFET